MELTLTPEEIYSLTHRKRAAEQLRELAKLRIPAARRIDNTVCVLRMHVTMLGTHTAAAPEPQLKSARR